MREVALIITEAELEALIDRRIEARLGAAPAQAAVEVPSPSRDILAGYERKRKLTSEELDSDELWEKREALRKRQRQQVVDVVLSWLEPQDNPRHASIRDRLADLEFHGEGDFYFFKATPGGLVKIGMSTNVPERLSYLRDSGGLARLECVAYGPGGCRVERLLHFIFREQREDWEWFRPTQAMADLIARFAATDWIWE